MPLINIIHYSNQTEVFDHLSPTELRSYVLQVWEQDLMTPIESYEGKCKAIPSYLKILRKNNEWRPQEKMLKRKIPTWENTKSKMQHKGVKLLEWEQ